MTQLRFEVLDIHAQRYAVVPILQVRVRIQENTGERVHAMLLRAQVRIDAQRRHYDETERTGLADLFGEPSRWGRTLKPFLWTHCAAAVPGFQETTEVELPIPATYDFECTAAKYLHTLGTGEVPLSLSFAGTVFVRGTSGFGVEQIAWHHDVEHRMPVEVWHALIAEHYPDTGWIRLRHDTVAALHRFKAERGLLDLDEACTTLLARSQAHAP
ncbi:DUF6084 family protein [Sciscionella marina]|uniref:DUF6084 family protein n=1 Tax=Sciscionella marina TaxID=508770 RepID=UPI000366E678|nr:DUF6084 family protein [Sciscionella marina]